MSTLVPLSCFHHFVLPLPREVSFFNRVDVRSCKCHRENPVPGMGMVCAAGGYNPRTAGISITDTMQIYKLEYAVYVALIDGNCAEASERLSMLRIARLRGFEEVMFVNCCVRIDLYFDCRGRAALTTILP